MALRRLAPIISAITADIICTVRRITAIISAGSAENVYP
jgi:hypothetical protein